MQASEPTTRRPRAGDDDLRTRAARSLVEILDRERALDGMFIAPRIVDRTAFEELSQALRELAREATEAGGTLQGSLGGVRELAEQARAADESLRKRAQSAARLVSTLDDRVARAEQAAEHLAERTLSSSELTARIEAMIEARVSDRADAAAERLTELASRLEQRAEQAESRLETRLNAIAERIEQRIAEFESRLEPLEARLERHASEAESRLRERLDTAQVDIESRLAEVEGRAAPLAERLDALTRDGIDGLEARAKEVHAGIERSSAELRERLDEVIIGVERRAAEIEETVIPARDVCEKAVEALGNAAAIDPDEIRELVTALQQAMRSAGEARTGLGAALDDAADRLAQLDKQRRSLCSTMEQGVQWMRELGPEMEEAAKASEERLMKLRRRQRTLAKAIEESQAAAGTCSREVQARTRELKSVLDNAMDTLGGRVEQAGTWLGKLIRHASEQHEALERLLAQVPAAAAESAADTPRAERSPRKTRQTDARQDAA